MHWCNSVTWYSDTHGKYYISDSLSGLHYVQEYWRCDITYARKSRLMLLWGVRCNVAGEGRLGDERNLYFGRSAPWHKQIPNFFPPLNSCCTIGNSEWNKHRPGIVAAASICSRCTHVWISSYDGHHTSASLMWKSTAAGSYHWKLGSARSWSPTR